MSGTVNITHRIAEDRKSLSRAFGQIADFLIAEPEKFINNPMRNLSEQIGVSEPTLIRFARHYGYQGLPDLRLAFAMSLASNDAVASEALEPRLKDKQVVNRDAKRAIALKAVELAAADDSLLLDSGSTVWFLAEELNTAAGKTIMTASLNAVLTLLGADQHRLIMPGGALRTSGMKLTGRMAENNLAEMTFDTAYLGADAIHPERGLSTFGEEEAHLNRAMIRASKRVVVMADSSKFRGPALHHICDLQAVDTIITDAALPAETRAAIEAVGTNLILADLPETGTTD